MTNFIKATLCALIVGLSTSVTAAPSKCANSYFNDERPDIVNPRLAKSTMELCSEGYAVWYSGVARAPLWAGQYLTKGRIQAGYDVMRSDDFREDKRLPSDWRAHLSDFRGSGFDRGHLAPSADMHTPAADSQSFLLSNMVAQDSKLNRGLWAAIEKAVRAQANYKPIYVITGAMFLGAKIDRLQNRVLVPTHLYKLIYDPERNLAGAYLVANAANKRHQEVSLQELEKMAGVKFLPQAQNVGKLKLPRPRY